MKPEQVVPPPTLIDFTLKEHYETRQTLKQLCTELQEIAEDLQELADHYLDQ